MLRVISKGVASWDKSSYDHHFLSSKDMWVSVQVRYLWQEDKSLLGTMSVWWDPDFMQRQISAHLAMLCGVMAPRKVLLEHDWKCSYCMFYHACGGPSRAADKHGHHCASAVADGMLAQPVQIQ